MPALRENRPFLQRGVDHAFTGALHQGLPGHAPRLHCRFFKQSHLRSREDSVHFRPVSFFFRR